MVGEGLTFQCVCMCVCFVPVPLALRVQLLQRSRDLLQQTQLFRVAVLPTGLDNGEQHQLDVVLPGLVLQQEVTHTALIRHFFTVRQSGLLVLEDTETPREFRP